MDDNRKIQSLKNLSMYFEAMKKLSLNDSNLSEDEKIYLLSCALLLLKKYDTDKRYTSYVELAYYIILKYSLTYSDYEPLYDFCVNFGFYPIAQTLTKDELISFESVSFSLIYSRIDSAFRDGEIIETFEQKMARDIIISSNNKEISYIAPTSFGKSSIIIDHIAANSDNHNRIGIIVPTKSLLAQTYRSIKDSELGYKILIHDEMYNYENRFIAIFTQERALRLLEKSDVFFDILYIDEAHRLLDRDPRTVLLSRLLHLNKVRNENQQVIYLSPLITNSANLKSNRGQSIFEQRIIFNVKEPEYFEYRMDTSIHKYNRFVDTFYPIGNQSNMFSYILEHKTEKTFCYLYSPRKIELFAKALFKQCTYIELVDSVSEVIDNLRKYVHDDFYEIEYLKKGIVYLHGKMPDNVKEYLEYKFSRISEIQFIIANKVILEGINLPIDSLFILSTYNLHAKDLANLIGRVNRLDQIFGTQPSSLHKLLPQIHFVNSVEYNQKNSKMSSKMQLLKCSISKDNVKNPLLCEFDFTQFEDGKDPIAKEKCDAIIKNEEVIFSYSEDSVQQLKKHMIELGMTAIYNISDKFCSMVHSRIQNILLDPDKESIHIMDKIKFLFVSGLEAHITDDEFLRLKDEQAIKYYKMFLENRRKALKKNVASEVLYFQRKAVSVDSRLYMGASYGEIPYKSSRGYSNNVYVDLRTKTPQQLANLAIVKQKIEEDFVNFKLNMFFQLLFDCNIISIDEYNMIVYGTTDPKKLHLVKMGLTISIINKLDEEHQLKNISIDVNNNLKGNAEFLTYKSSVDDFYRFELSKFL